MVSAFLCEHRPQLVNLATWPTYFTKIALHLTFTSVISEWHVKAWDKLWKNSICWDLTPEFQCLVKPLVLPFVVHALCSNGTLSWHHARVVTPDRKSENASVALLRDTHRSRNVVIIMTRDRLSQRLPASKVIATDVFFLSDSQPPKLERMLPRYYFRRAYNAFGDAGRSVFVWQSCEI